MKPFKRIGALLFFLTLFNTNAQEGIPVYFDYLSDNYYLVFPSMAGANRQGGKIRLTARKQWFDIDRAPNLQTLNGHLRVGEKSGVGMILYRDENGYHSQGGVKLTYAHHLSFARNSVDLNQLSFGFSAGYIQSSLDESEFVSLFPDNAITGTNNSVSYFNVDLGMSYHFLEFYAHLAVKNALGSQRDLYSAEEIDNLRRYLGGLGYVFDLNGTNWVMEPSVLFQLSEYTKEATADINMKAYYKLKFGKLWGGLSYRRSLKAAQYNVESGLESQRLEMVTPIIGINIKNFMISYNYSYQTGDIRFDNGGFHQITLGYDFWQGSEPYECNCPAMNY
ncbi:PorP/SprF family type IX secretion system membrane protein [Abyssalbus ytuae]|uniref:Type IX secretion system membrane protein PorP/SprF n=1 Tax=Abyssalbus ytuae TaxID=2926907 RepID=A0A9E6ZR01_9FLAO|nr:type IX secretion system membrane protein PorP/SprF [Abyssalbus ytuae]UOB18960.1 type IX secretion system membrane protein PorP/SprF [Abyssalbus ytuae]